MTKKATKSKGVHYDKTIARRKALQLLYQAQILGQPLRVALGNSPYIEEIGVLPEYAGRLIQGLDSHITEIDSCLSKSSENWTLERMPLVDRCILRLAIYEMRYVENVPISVSINEAIELAHEFGGEDGSGSFVNGVLGNVAKSIKASGEDVVGENAVDEHNERKVNEMPEDDLHNGTGEDN